MKIISSLMIACMGLVSSLSALTATSLFPVSGSTGLCLDAPLRIHFDQRPAMNWGGSIRIRNLENNIVVKTWDLSTNPGDPQTTDVSPNWPWKDSVGYTQRNVWPLVLDSVPGNLAQVRIPQHLLQPNTQYQVEVDGSVLKGADGSAFSGIAAGAWTFTTGNAPTSKSTIIVADDNSGDVCSIERGIELVPSNSKTPVQVLVRAGYYREMIAAKSKSQLQLYGAGTDQTFIRYFNSNNLNDNGSAYRNMVILQGNQMSLRALSLTNTVNVAGGQAEALYLQGDSNIVADVFLHSFQDTWLNNGGRAYVQDATIEGSVDFIWGYSPVFFKRTTLVMNRTGSVIVQPRNDDLHHGYVFDSCTIKADKNGYSGSHFARDAGASYAYGEVMFLHTRIENGTFLAPAPWTINATTDSTKLRFCEYQSMDAAGSLLTISGTQRQRLQCSADSVTAHAQPSFVLSGWTPNVPSLASILALTGSAIAPAQIIKHGAGSSSQGVTVGDSIVAFSFAWLNATTVTVSGMPAGLTATVDNAAKIVSISGAVSAAPGDYTYTVTTVGGDSNVTRSGVFSVVSDSTNIPTDVFTKEIVARYSLLRSTSGFELHGTTGREILEIVDSQGHLLVRLHATVGSTRWQASGLNGNQALFLVLRAGALERSWMLVNLR